MGGFDHIDWEIIAFEVEKKCFGGHPNFGQLQFGEAFAHVNFTFLLELFFLSSCDKVGHMSKKFIAFQIGEHVPKNSNRKLASRKLSYKALFSTIYDLHI